jgi:hypothetical protein
MDERVVERARQGLASLRRDGDAAHRAAMPVEQLGPLAGAGGSDCAGARHRESRRQHGTESAATGARHVGAYSAGSAARRPPPSASPLRALASSTSTHRQWCSRAQFTSTWPVPIASNAPSMPIEPR